MKGCLLNKEVAAPVGVEKASGGLALPDYTRRIKL